MGSGLVLVHDATRCLIAGDLPMRLAAARVRAWLQLRFEPVDQGLPFHTRDLPSRQPSLGPQAGQHLLRTLADLFQAVLGVPGRHGLRTWRWLFLTSEAVILHGIVLLFAGVNPGLHTTGLRRLIDGTTPRSAHMRHRVTQTPKLVIMGGMHLPSIGIHTTAQQGDVGVGYVTRHGRYPFHEGMSGPCANMPQQHPRHAWAVDQRMRSHRHH